MPCFVVVLPEAFAWRVTFDHPVTQPIHPTFASGGWPFSTAAHGWPIADCTAEGLKGVLALMDEACVVQGGVPLIPDER